MPEVTSRSPFWISALPAMKRSSSMPEGPPPKATARRPLRTTWTGIAVVLVGDQRHFETSGCTRVTWPTTPASSATGLPGFTPCWSPRLMNTLCAYGSRPAYRISAGVDLTAQLLGCADQPAQLRGLGFGGLVALRSLRQGQRSWRAAQRCPRTAAPGWRSSRPPRSRNRSARSPRAAADRRPGRARPACPRRSESARRAPAARARARQRRTAGRAGPVPV